jgi:hypothetical protein
MKKKLQKTLFETQVECELKPGNKILFNPNNEEINPEDITDPFYSMGEYLVTFELPIVLTNQNQGQGRGWQAKYAEKKQIDKILSVFKLPVFRVPVGIRVIRVLGKRQKLFDESSVLRGNWKPIEDSLVDHGVFVDDRSKYIREIRVRQVRSTDGVSCVRIQVYKWIR